MFHLSVWLGAEPTFALLWLAALVTFAAHAGLWAAAAALLARRKALSSAAQHRLWKLALFGPLATTLLAAALPWDRDRASGSPVLFEELSVGTTSRDTSAEPSGPEAQGRSTSRTLALVAVLAPALGLLRFAGSALRFRRALRGRRRVDDERFLRRLSLVGDRFGRRGVALTESPEVDGPVLIGASEICVPAGKLARLGDAELDAVFAHELAHLERRDGVWFPLAGLVQTVLWMQPFTRWVASSFRLSAELACDDRAVEVIGDPLPLARALTHVAEGASVAPGRVLVPTMARPASAVLRRVRRLTSGATARGEARPRSVAWLGVVGFATVGMNVEVASPRPPEPAAVVAPASAEMESSPLSPALDPDGIHVPPPPDPSNAEPPDECTADDSLAR
jgi:Zn-dependent protease with chaperone function